MSDFDAAALAQLKKDVGDEMMPLIFEQFLAELASKREEIERATDQGDVAQLAESAHSLKSTAGTLGLRALAEYAASVEHDARQGTGAALQQAAGLLTRIDQGRQHLSSYQA